MTSSISCQAIGSLLLGLFGLIAWLILPLGWPVSILGLLLAQSARRSCPSSSISRAAFILCLVALFLCIGYSFLEITLIIH